MRKLLVLGLMVLPLLAAGCSKGPAEAALKAADEAIAKVAPDAEKFVPDQFKTLTDAAAAAKASFDKGDYAAALAAAKDLPAKATEVLGGAGFADGVGRKTVRPGRLTRRAEPTRSRRPRRALAGRAPRRVPGSRRCHPARRTSRT